MDLTDIIDIVVKKYNIDCIGLFGSRARNDHNEYSDYDLFIIAHIDLDTELILESEFETLLNAPVDLISLSKDTDVILLKNIMNDSVILYNQNDKYEKLYSFVENFFIENHDFLKLREHDLIYG
ncbi:nucleotidyltransferase family protein [Clostridium gasigenes]|uniref:Nucleotidyltransferase domain-containing protein n=1 Tax=Clostridium gasigenes TaxID=94869 RepID=A0A1H0V9Z6_9CLOT|nr:nucleotidyltransferase domain-containing protein [Clostridium gasigenes]MBB6714582.1 nucleotidyltransferase domain-containing protein [Clostridium gasigenes]SDP75193.1 Predicted nucleotidyltransferase [Clostridium gasigenes]